MKREQFLTPAEVGAIMRLNPRTVNRMARDGEIPSVRIGRVTRFPRAKLFETLGIEEPEQKTSTDDDK